MIHKTTITSSDWMKLGAFYFLTTVARAIMVFTCWPLLKRSGYGLSTKEFYVIVWGGLRGALGITLSLMVAVDEELPFRLRELTVFYMAGLATLTLLVNGSTCKSLCKYLELIENPPIKAKLLKNSKQSLLLKSEEKINKMSEDKYLNLAKWGEVDALIGKKHLEDSVSEDR